MTTKRRCAVANASVVALALAAVTAGTGAHAHEPLRGGDHVEVPVYWGRVRAPITHHGVVVERSPGRVEVAQRDGRPGGPRGVSTTTVAGFAREAGVDAVRVVHDRTVSREQAQATALRQVGDRRFNLLSNNCEHFARGAVRGRAESPQAQRLARVAGAALGGPPGYFMVREVQRLTRR